MKDRIYLVFNKKKVDRMVKTGPPQTKAGERFVAIDIVADQALWTPERIPSVAVNVGPSNTPAPPTQVDLAKVPGVCYGKMLPKKDGKHGTIFACTSCDYTETWNSGASPHWKFAKGAK